MEELNQMYQELQGFINTRNFHKLGFAPISPYKEWYKRISKTMHAEGVTKEHAYLAFRISQLAAGAIRTREVNQEDMNEIETLLSDQNI